MLIRTGGAVASQVMRSVWATGDAAGHFRNPRSLVPAHAPKGACGAFGSCSVPAAAVQIEEPSPNGAHGSCHIPLAVGVPGVAAGSVPPAGASAVRRQRGGLGRGGGRPHAGRDLATMFGGP